jgi:hemoglobin
LSHAFSHGFNPDHVRNLAAYWAEVFGGPPTYSQRLGGHSGMLTLHAGTGMDEDWADRFSRCFLQAIDDARLPDDPEFRRGLREYIEFAVQDIVRYSPEGSQVPAELPLPHWTWTGLA